MSVIENKNAKNDLFVKYDQKIDELVTFRDKYFLLNEPHKTIDNRIQDLTSRLNELERELEAHRDEFDSKASFLVLVGKANNVLPDFNQKACDSLKKATKLEPKSLEAWNYLGECYWKNKDFEMCRNCFEQSLNIAKNKIGLRGMSMVIRQLINVPQDHENKQTPTTNKYEHIKNLIEESIKFAKDALQLDLKDGISWYILANCYVSKFFSPFGQQSPNLIKQALSAYDLALKDTEKAYFQSDLYFNKSMITMYEENWADGLHCLGKALELDPHWEEAKENLKGTLDYLTQLQQMIRSKGKLKERKFQSLIDSIKKSDLGPYLEHTRINEDNKLRQYELVEANLSDLKKGLNKNKVLVGKIVCGLLTKNPDNIVCFSAVLSDSNGDCAALTIYNLASGHGVIIGNSICIPEPWLESQNFNFNLDDYDRYNMKLSETNERSHSFQFKSIRVENPSVLVVNGKKWTKEKISSAFFVPKVMSD